MYFALALVLLAAVISAVVYVLISIVECYEDRSSLRRSAITRGYAEWGTNPANGKPQFQWKTFN